MKIGKSKGYSGKGSKGLKTAGAVLGSMAAVGTIGGLDKNLGVEHNLTQALGGLFLAGVGGTLYYLGKKKEKQGKGVSSKILPVHHDIMKKILSHKRSVHVDQLKFTADEKAKALASLKQIMEQVDLYKQRIKSQQSGQGVKLAGGKWKLFQKLKKGFNKAGNELKEFWAGHRKFKPSRLFDVASKVLAVASAILTFVPGVGWVAKAGVSAASAGLAVGSSELKKQGRGLKSKSQLLSKHEIPYSGQTGEGLLLAGQKSYKSKKLKKRRKYGSRMEVYKNLADKTKGGMMKSDIFYDEKSNRYKSKKMMKKGAGMYQKYLKDKSRKNNVQKK